MSKKDWLIALGVIFSWGINFMFMKFALLDISPMVLGMLRFAFLIFPAVFFFTRPDAKWRWLILYGLTISFGQFAFMFLALSINVPTGLAALVHQSQVFFTVILAALLFKEGVRRHHAIAMLIAIIGLALIGVGQYQGGMALAGLIIVMMGSFSWALGNIIVKKLGNVNPLSLVIWGNLSALAAFSIGSFWLYGTDGVMTQIGTLGGLGWISVLYLAYVASLLGYGGWGYLLSRYPASQVTPLALLVPVVALLTGVVLLSERLTTWHWVGIITVMAGLLVHVFGAKKFAHCNY
ncbi:MAG: EamA family transporter [Moraxella sp.]|nr:EamA family transporter [Moraxella sp.]